MRSKIGAALVGTLLWASVLVTPAHAAFPGANGKIAFFSNRDGSGQIYTMSPDGSGVVQLTQGPDVNGAGKWSPDGRKIVFASNSSANPSLCDSSCVSEIYVMNADGTSQARLTTGAADLQPSWSPDGTKIAFDRRRCNPACDDDIYVMNADGSNEVDIDPGAARDFQPAWSPDGQKIAFNRFDGVDSEIYVMKPDGTGQTNLTNDPDFPESQPEWSPDAKEIAYTRAEPCISQDCGIQTQSFAIYAMGSDGSGQTSIAQGGQGPIWSPDGSKIAYTTQVECGDFSCSGNDPVVMNADGSGQVRLTNNPFRRFDEPSSWQPIPGPQRGDYKNAARFCKAERDFLGDAAFTRKYGGGANAYGKCVSGGK